MLGSVRVMPVQDRDEMKMQFARRFGVPVPVPVPVPAHGIGNAIAFGKLTAVNASRMNILASMVA